MSLRVTQRMRPKRNGVLFCACVAPGSDSRATVRSMYSGENRRLVCFVISSLQVLPPGPESGSNVIFGPGLDDDRYVIERFQSKADGEILPRHGKGASKKGRGKASREIVSLSTVQRMRPERDEIIICTGLNCSNLGVQYWGDRAVGLFVNAKYR